MSVLSRVSQRLSQRLLHTRQQGPAALQTLAGRVFNRTTAAFAAGAVAAMPIMGGDDFFEHKFVTQKEPEDIIDFYSTEDFLQILGIFPFAIHFVLAGVEWDKKRENTMAVYNSMEISFTLEEREEETADGEKVVGFFQKRERFKNFIPLTPFLMWDQVQCYGYKRRDDGTIEVFHKGEYFNGPLPIRLLVQLHARYVIWATEKHINSAAFGKASLEEQEHQRSNIPLHAFTDFMQRLYTAQQVAVESGKLAVGASTEEAEATLKKLRRLKQSPTTVYVSTVKKLNLKKRLSKIEVEDPEMQLALNKAMMKLSKSKEGQEAAAKAFEEMMSHPEVRVEKERYGGAFKARTVKM